MRTIRLLSFLMLIAIVAVAQEEKAKPRVFITDSQSWEVSGGFGGGGAKPQTAEIIKTFDQKCPSVTVTMKQDKADYVVLLEHEGGKPIYLRDSKYAVFKADGDAIKSGSTRALGNAVKDACAALMKDWQGEEKK